MNMQSSYYSLAATLIVCLFCVNWPMALCDPDEAPGWVTPLKVEQLDGGHINITCNLNLAYYKKHNLERCNGNNLYFETNDKVYNTSSHIEYINDTSVVFRDWNVSQQVERYMCMCNGKVLQSVQVSVGTKPLNVTDFNCISYDALYMVCNFTKPNNYLNTNYSLTYKTENSNDGYYYDVECNFDYSPSVTCNMSNQTYKKYHAYFNFTLFIINDFGFKQQEFFVSHFARMIPGLPGNNMTAVNTTSDAICLHWENKRRSMYKPGLVWQVYVTPQQMPTIIRTDGWRNSTKSVVNTICLDKLPYAGYNYTLNLRCRNNVPNSLWSDTFVYNFTTAEERPRRPPLITNGSYYVDSSETRLRLYWEQLEPYEYNGKNFGYEISEYRKNGELQDATQISVDQNSAEINNWDKHAKHEVVIRSKNDVNSSMQGTNMFIPAISDAEFRVSKPKNIRSVYHSSNKSYTLSWDAPENRDDLINYTVFWCNAKPAILSQCRDSIHFRNVSAMKRLFTTKPNQPTDLNMAVSANFARFNTGMHWVICSSDLNDDLIKMEPTIDEVTNSSLTLKWSTERVCPVILRGYNVTYCQRAADKPENCTTVNINNREAKHVYIHHLQPYTYYSVKILMYSGTKISRYSDELINRTGEAAPSPPRDLTYRNLTNSSVELTWKPPLKANGVVRDYLVYYIHNNKTDIFKLRATSDELVNADKPVVHKLTNLTAYTDYELSVQANTLYASLPSNSISFRTAVGVPLTPTLHSTSKVKEYTKLEWHAPLRAAGRIDFYEVVVSTLDYNNTLLKRDGSYLVPRQNLSYKVLTPKCESNNQIQYQVRAVNVEPLLANIKPLDANFNESEIDLLRTYNNSQRYRQHKSEWSSYKGTCFNNDMVQYLESVEVIVAIIVIALAIRCLYAKYRLMSNIECSLPAGVLESLKKPMENGTISTQSTGSDGIGSCDISNGINCIRENNSPQYTSQSSQHDFSGGNEMAKLLFKAPVGNGRFNDNDSHIYAEPSDIYMLEQQQPNVTNMHDDYTSASELMNINLNTNNENMHAVVPVPASGTGGGYIKPTQMKSWSNTLPTSQSMEASTAQFANNGAVADITAANPNSMPLNGYGYVPVPILPKSINVCNYVQASDLHQFKAIPSIAANDIFNGGYTSMERAGLFNKPAVNPTTATADMPVNRNHQQQQQQHYTMQQPNIAGYVTPHNFNPSII